MVVPAQDHGTLQAAVSDGVVERRGDFCTAMGVGVQDARLRTHDQLVGLGLANPAQVVLHLLLDVFRSFAHQALQHLRRDGVRGVEVGRIAAATHPAERPKAVVKAHGPHDVLDVRRVTEPVAVFCQDVRPRPARFQQERVAVVEEVRSARRVFVHGSCMTLEGVLDVRPERVRIFRHHGVGVVERQPGRIVSTRPRVVQGGLV